MRMERLQGIGNLGIKQNFSNQLQINPQEIEGFYFAKKFKSKSIIDQQLVL